MNDIAKKINRNTAIKETHPVDDTQKSNEERILAFAQANGHIARSDAQVLLDISQATANRILKRMVAGGLLYQEGSGRKTHYKKK